MDLQVPTPAVGIDVVDRHARGLPRGERRQRFGARVLTPGEASKVETARAPARELWLRWAAKEAAFKAMAGRWEDPGRRPRFRPTALEVFLGESGGGYGAGEERPGVSFRVVWESDGRVEGWVVQEGAAICAVAWGKEEEGGGEGVKLEMGWKSLRRRGSEWREELGPRFSDREWDGIHSRASAVVRLEARAHAARFLGRPEEELEVTSLPGTTGRSPPRLLQGGLPVPVGISLSHHGRFVAWVLRGRGGVSRGGGGA